ncbi:MAG: DUF2093 domain-containing protein [Alphaproteobacteria bacterium]|nr:MAG: DUF2093 domain-containing protein [Alphaproteobacteria bacterium]
MNFHDPNAPGARKAELLYLDGDFEIEVPGDYVLCEVTGQRIPLEDLKYWNIERQEAYVSAEVSDKRERDLKKAGK